MLFSLQKSTLPFYPNLPTLFPRSFYRVVADDLSFFHLVSVSSCLGTSGVLGFLSDNLSLSLKSFTFFIISFYVFYDQILIILCSKYNV